MNILCFVYHGYLYETQEYVILRVAYIFNARKHACISKLNVLPGGTEHFMILVVIAFTSVFWLIIWTPHSSRKVSCIEWSVWLVVPFLTHWAQWKLIWIANKSRPWREHFSQVTSANHRCLCCRAMKEKQLKTITCHKLSKSFTKLCSR